MSIHKAFSLYLPLVLCYFGFYIIISIRIIISTIYLQELLHLENLSVIVQKTIRIRSDMVFFNDVYEVVKSIPYGRVLSYGQVAALSGHRGCARQVGYALHSNPDPENIPCFRVVFKDGSLASGFAFGGKDEQRRLLEAEGVEFYGEKVKKEYFC